MSSAPLRATLSSTGRRVGSGRAETVREPLTREAATRPLNRPNPIRPVGRRAMSLALFALAIGWGLVPATGVAQADPQVLNLYSARHYQTDERLYSDFTKATGIRINRIEAGDEALLERLRSEGRSSPADVLLLVDAARLAKADSEGLFRPTRSAVLDARIPAELRSADKGQGSTWFTVSTRARVIVINKAKVDPSLVKGYMDLARPELKGKVCTRSGAHPYMLSLISAMVEHHGEARTAEWARGVVANLARKPRGGDTDQIKSVAAGECDVALTNSYYLARLMNSSRADERAISERVSVVWPDQGGAGTHMNVSGGGVLTHARNPQAAVRFLEYLAGDSAQVMLADGNNEWPAVPGVKISNRALEAMGTFKRDPLPVERLSRSQATAARIIDQAGWR
jgi:iron(III) transport system substrate-binding protein